MDAQRWVLAVAFVLAGCSPDKARSNGQFVEHGRQYTAWLYGNEYNKLWDRFSPEMRQTFGSVGDLATFASRALTRLGPERRLLDESVQDADPLVVYTRDASFDKSRQRMLIEWSLAKDGAVTGLVVRPSPEEEKRKQ
ncbi:MAG TPA: hypothetical protein VFH26_07440 [Gemmatimonadales bacterium]|nr:hypothetical protein [Gemmatimonadales bacterium]